MSSITSFKFIVGPDGKMKTVTDYDAVTQEQLEALRKEVKDMIAGNKQFHDDPYTPKEEDLEEEISFHDFIIP